MSSKYQKWAAQQKGNPSLLIVAVVGATCFCVGGYHWFYKPYSLRKKRQEDENYANYIFEQENSHKNQ